MLLVLAASGAPAAAVGDREEYAECLAEVELRPSQAFERALAWRDEGGGFAARHCAAMALVALGQHDRAADRMERLAEDMQAVGHGAAVEVLAQAGNAWLMAGYTNRAEGVFGAALGLDPDNAELRVDRARTRGELGDYAGAAIDLDRALELAPEHVEALVFRASANRHLGRPDDAARDLARALKLKPDDPEALLERGLLALGEGDLEGGRRDLLKVRLLAPGTKAAELAGLGLQRLELGDD